MMRWHHVGMLAAGLVTVAGCEKPSHYTTTVEVTQVQRFGQDKSGPGMMDLDLKFVECPGDAHKTLGFR